ncbi:hypothetical protein IEO21_06547 [Rhodonia placenta]|uniref:Uncharacterized protein n=1 Tax=Rhodonia placenta TaxID=104341 RepID=A0A8H7P099_9APHY|nr:hypothetical protein IEO21_06547 [Postia placenta]
MSTDSVDIERRIDKGKARARSPEPTEDTPLLGSASGSYTSRVEPETTPRRLYSKLVSVFLISLSSCVVLLLLVVLIVFSYRSRAVSASPDEILQHAVVLRGPDGVDVLNTTGDGGVWLLVRGRVGVDAGEVAGVKEVAGDNILQDAWKSIGRWGIRRLDRVTVNLSSIEISPESDPSNPLTTLTFPPMELPLTANPPPDNSWLTPVAIPVLIRPTKDIQTLKRFVRDSWKRGQIRVQAVVDHAIVQGGGLDDGGWRQLITVAHSNIHTKIHITIPRLPGLPPAGRDEPLPGVNQLLTLQSFRVTSEHDTLALTANATVINPLSLDLDFTSPVLPFTVSLPPVNASTDYLSVPIANVTTQSFTLTHPNISLSINGTVLPFPRDAFSALSAFLSNYVSAIDSDIILSTPFFPGLSLPAKFPAPHPKPTILRDVTIHDMKIKPVGSGMAASGTVLARVVLPHGIEVGVDVVRVFPDVIVYDGPVPDPAEGQPQTASASRVLNYPVDDHDDVPPAPPLPDPLPERAFAHIRPGAWLASVSEPAESGDGEGSAVSVSANIVDVPLEVLPGREREFSNFVSKVIFGTQGAIAGVQGVAAVAVHVHGLPFENGRDGEMELTGLPFQGSVRIGKRTLLGHFTG